MLTGDTFRGHVRHMFVQFPVRGAEIVATVVGDSDLQEETVSDVLGYFQLSSFTAGQRIQLRATHPAYLPEDVSVVLSETDSFRAIELTPIGDINDYHTISVQVFGAVTQFGLRRVPVSIRRFDMNGAFVSESLFLTDQKGFVVMNGARSGLYEFRINNSNDPLRRLKYDQYFTPANERVSIKDNHLVNVFLKPETQDLRVSVRGFDFKKKQAGQPLADILVELTGFDPQSLDDEVLHTRSDFTQVFPGNQSSTGETTVDRSVIAVGSGEVVFTKLPPAAYRVTLSRLGYLKQEFLLVPDDKGNLEFSDDNPLVVALREELTFPNVQMEFADYRVAQPDDFGRISGPGIQALGMTVRAVGIENSNTEGLVYEGETGLSLSGRVVGQFFLDNVMCGRYRVFVDGISRERVQRRNAFGFPEGISPAYHLEAFGEGVMEILPSTGFLVGERFPKTIVELQTPKVTVNGQLVEAESLEPTSGEPIFRPLANQEIIFETIAEDNHLVQPTRESVVTDDEGRFAVTLLPGAFGILVPGREDFFGDEVVVTVGDAVFESDANNTRTYEWPLVDAFPDVGVDEDEFGLQDRYFQIGGIPIHAGQEQYLELRLKKETYFLVASGDDASDVSTKVIARTPEDQFIGAEYSFALSSRAEATLKGSTGSYPSRISPPPVNEFGNPLRLRWDRLPPGDYTDVSATITGHQLNTENFGSKTFLDWPPPGRAPSPEQARLFVGEGIPNNELIWEPVQRVDASSDFDQPAFKVELEDYTPNPYSRFVWDTREINNQTVTRYFQTGSETLGGVFEVAFAPGLYDGFAELGGPITAVWTLGEDADGNRYPVRVPAGGQLFLGGPEPTFPSNYPDISFTLSLEAVAQQDEATPIFDVPFALDGSVDPASGGQPREIRTGNVLFNVRQAPRLTKVGNDNYVVTSMSEPIVVSSAANPEVRINVGLEQGMEVNATVQEAGTPLDGVGVAIHNRYGRQLVRSKTNEAGEVQFKALSGPADVFLVIEEPGYQPIRRRLKPAEATPGTDASTSLVHTITQPVSLLPQPQLHQPGIPLNRWGPFFPNVTRSGNVKVETGLLDYGPFQAASTLNTIWKLELTPATLDYTLPGYDDGTGGAAPGKQVRGPDKIVEAYLVDHRRFQRPGFLGGTTSLTNELSFLLPLDETPIEMAATLRELTSPAQDLNQQNRSSRKRRVFVSKAKTIRTNTATGRTEVSGDFQLWDAPPGDFQPVIIVRTASGAFRRYDVDYSSAPEKRLLGIQLPPWMGDVLDLLGIAAGASGTQTRFKDFVPKGLLIPLPEFKAEIKLDQKEGEPGGFIDYLYSLAVAQEVGQEGKASGLLSLGPGFLGAKVKAQGTIQSKGRGRAASFSIGGSINKEKVLSDEYASKLEPRPSITPSVSDATGSITTTASFSLDKNDPFEFGLTNNIAGGARGKIEVKLNDYAKPIPYVGPVIGLLGDSEALVFQLETSLAADFGQTYSFTTRRPRDFRVSTRPRGEQVTEKTVFGGWGLQFETDRKLCVGVEYKSGLSVNFAKGLGTARADFVVGGAGCGTKFPTMQMDVNPTGTWPVVNSIKGEVKIIAEAKADYGVVKPKWDWKYDIIQFDVQFGTDTQVQHIPYEEAYIDAGSLAAGRNLLVPTGPRIVDEVAPASSASVVGADGGRLIYTGHDPEGGADVVQLTTQQPDGRWSAPEELFRVPRIGPMAALELVDGSVAIAYVTPMAETDLFDPLAACEVLVRRLDMSGMLSEPELVGRFRSPSELMLAQATSSLGLLVLTPVLAEAAIQEEIHLVQHDGAAWEPSRRFAMEAGFKDLEITAVENELAVVWINDMNQLKAQAASQEAASILSSEASAFSAVPAANGLAILGALNSGELTLYQSAAPQFQETVSRVVSEEVQTSELAMIARGAGASAGFAIVWTESVPLGTEIRYLSIDAAGNPLGAELGVTENPQGRYEDIRLSALNDNQLSILARFRNGDARELRRFVVDMATGMDSQDSDVDSLRDLAELRIVDFDPEDLITSIESVLPDDDFDGDGFSNQMEMAAGSDPISPESIPGSGEGTIKPIEAWTATNFGTLADPAIAGLFEDPDGDGVVNLLEYAHATNPLVPDENAGASLSIQLIEDETPSTVEIQYRVNPLAADLAYEVQIGQSLTEFIGASNFFTEVGRTSHPDGSELVRVRPVSPAVLGNQSFLRLQVKLTED